MPLWSLIPPALSLGKMVYGAINKPKKSDFGNTRLVEAYQNQITENRNNIEGKSLMHSMMKPAIRQSAVNRERSKQGIAERLAKGQLTEGQAQQAEISSNTAINKGLTDVQDNAMSSQIQQNREDQRAIDKARLEVGQLQDQARQQYTQANNQWKGDMFSAGAELVTGGLNAFQQNVKDAKLSGFVNKVTQGVNWDDPEAVMGVMNKIQIFKTMGIDPTIQQKIGD